jgi:molecular chaperone GrpE
MNSDEKPAAPAAGAAEISGEGIQAEWQQKLSEAQAKAEEYRNQVLRVQAELENMRRRHERELEQAHKYALEKFVGELLPVKDNLERGLVAASGEVVHVEKLREGVDLTLKMLHSVLEKAGVQEVDPLGQRFNPERHQAMSMQEHPEAEPNTVLAVFQKGYLLNDRLVRPAMVVVASAASGKARAENNEQKQVTNIDELA